MLYQCVCLRIISCSVPCRHRNRGESIMESTKVEFTVEIPRGQNIEHKIRDTFQNFKATTVAEIDAITGRVVLESAQCWPDLLTQIESTGLRAALTGFGGRAAVSIVDKGAVDTAKGVIRFTSPTAEAKQLVVDGVIDGLEPEKQFRIQVHECGDLSGGCCENVGDMYGARQLGTTTANADGRISFRYSDDQFCISDLIGRSVVVTDKDQRRLACGIIARAAGINENFKKICACDGITLWDERNVPVAGGARATFADKK